MADSDMDLFNRVAAKKAANLAPVSAPNPARRVSGVTAANYATMAKAFLDAGNSETFVIVERYVTIRGERKAPTNDQWAAWKAFFWSIGKSTMHMDNAGYLTVPCQWPHDFCADWTVAQSAEAIHDRRHSLRDRIAESHRPVDREVEAAGRALRKRNKVFWERKRQEMAAADPVPVRHVTTPPRPITDDDLIASAARINAYLAAKGA